VRTEVRTPVAIMMVALVATSMAFARKGIASSFQARRLSISPRPKPVPVAPRAIRTTSHSIERSEHLPGVLAIRVVKLRRSKSSACAPSALDEIDEVYRLPPNGRVVYRSRHSYHLIGAPAGSRRLLWFLPRADPLMVWVSFQHSFGRLTQPVKLTEKPIAARCVFECEEE